jgi:hypothetical protein
MSVRTGICLVGVVLVLLALSCTRLQDARSDDIARQELPHLDAIPASWGQLISVSNVTHYPDHVQLWFQDSDGVIRIVPYSITNGNFVGHFRMIPRK